VIRDDKDRIQGIRYNKPAPKLLNEVQHQTAQLHKMRH
jgi:hypothetical protein